MQNLQADAPVSSVYWLAGHELQETAPPEEKVGGRQSSQAFVAELANLPGPQYVHVVMAEAEAAYPVAHVEHSSTEPSLKLPGGQASMPVRSDPVFVTLLPVGTGEQ